MAHTAMCHPSGVQARSAIFGERLLLPQERGDRVELIVYGDEFYARYETLSGHTAVYDPSIGRFAYAQLASGHLVSTGVPVEKPPPPGLPTHLREDPAVRNERFGRRYEELRPRPALGEGDRLQTFGVQNGLLEGRRLSQGQIRGLTILVDFPDVQTSVTAADVDALLNQQGYSANGNRGSVRDYFLTVSGGKLDYRNTVVGPIRLSKPQSFYERTSLVPEALRLAVQAHGVNLADYDSRGEGIVDAVNFMYAGRTVYKDALWPHNGVEEIRFPNGIKTHFYMLTSLGRERVDLSIGTFCHESGHLLCRWPDQYDYGKRDGDFEESAGIGRFCLMGSGNHLGSGRAPAAVSAYLRDLVDWPTETVLLNQPGRYELRQGDYSRVYKFETGQPNEYFLVENRTRAGIDSQLPASGLAVYHCDTLGSNEWEDGTQARHYAIALLQADGSLDLEHNRNNGDATDLYGAVAGVALGDATVPSSRLWSGSSSGLTLSEVGAPGTVIAVTAGVAPERRGAAGEVKADLLIPDAAPAGIASTIELGAAGNRHRHRGGRRHRPLLHRGPARGARVADRQAGGPARPGRLERRRHPRHLPVRRRPRARRAGRRAGQRRVEAARQRRRAARRGPAQQLAHRGRARRRRHGGGAHVDPAPRDPGRRPARRRGPHRGPGQRHRPGRPRRGLDHAPVPRRPGGRARLALGGHRGAPQPPGRRRRRPEGDVRRDHRAGAGAAPRPARRRRLDAARPRRRAAGRRDVRRVDPEPRDGLAGQALPRIGGEELDLAGVERELELAAGRGLALGAQPRDDLLAAAV